MTLKRTPLTSGWTFKQADAPDGDFLPVSQFPTCIHLDLMHHGKIPDPLLDDNETKVQWVGEEAWAYRTEFAEPERGSKDARVELVFEGLDTFAVISLNGEVIQRTENMHIGYRVDVSDKLQAENVLEIRFESAFLLGRQLENEAGGPPIFCCNGHSSRVQVRKAAYSYGWDWGPIMLTCGPWRPIYVEKFETRISDLSFLIDVAESLSSATIKATAEVEGSSPQSVKFELHGPDGQLIQENDSSSLQSDFEVENPELWYSAGNGRQPLYTLKATAISADSTVLCTSSKRLGIRRLELIQRPLKSQPGITFFFMINNTPVFSRGADWIPTSHFLPRTTPEEYRKWIQLTADANMNMIRVWGGGIYEPDIFYDYCDELGILVWQDFMLGCGSFPATPKFLKQIEEEAVYNLKRMRAHPSIALWCGNNEDHMFADKFAADQYDVDDKDPEHWLKSKWPARIIYDKLLPELCSKYVPHTPYHPGSPWGGKPSNDPTVGDVHAWDVWMKSSAQYPYQWYPKISGRFVSEFGMKAYPTLRTIKEFITDPKDRFPQSRIMDAHLKASSTSLWARDFRTIALYMMENVKHGFTLEQYTYASLLIQAEAMMYAFSGWRRLWKGPGDEQCAGILVWQLNDAWPSVSWSLADSSMRRKYAYWSVKRALEPISVGISREEVEKSRDSEFTAVHVRKEKRIQVWGSNFTTAEEEIELVVQGIELATGKCTWEKKTAFTLRENRSTELLDEPLPDAEATTIFCARILKGGKILARYFDWPQPLRYLDLPLSELRVQVEGDNIHVSSPLPVKGLAFEVDDDDVIFEDNCVDVIPGDDRVIQAKGLNGGKVSSMHLGLAV